MSIIGIRREDKNPWERRAPLIPKHVKELKEKHSIDVVIQPSKIRAFSDQDYEKAGAIVKDDLSQCPIIFAIKEVPLSIFERGKTYVFFSHTIKGQKHNMPMLKKMLEMECTLIDYEKVVDEKGRRLIFFGRHAGLAGMIDTLWAFGKRLDWEGIDNPFSSIRRAYNYNSIEEAKEEIAKVGKNIRNEGLNESLTPLICGFAGYGNVSQGAQEIFDLLPVENLNPDEIASIYDASNHLVYKVVFKEEHMVLPISPDNHFELQDYYNHPEKYKSRFESYLPYLSILMNCIYWDERYPRLVTKDYLRRAYSNEKRPKLRIIGDISCDIEGAIECTVKSTAPDKPVFVYNPLNGKVIDGYKGSGVVVMAVDNLPCELPRESSAFFSNVLKEFIPEIVKADFSADFEHCKLPSAIKNAVIAYHGELTPNYRYIEKYL